MIFRERKFLCVFAALALAAPDGAKAEEPPVCPDAEKLSRYAANVGCRNGKQDSCLQAVIMGGGAIGSSVLAGMGPKTAVKEAARALGKLRAIELEESRRQRQAALEVEKLIQEKKIFTDAQVRTYRNILDQLKRPGLTAEARSRLSRQMLEVNDQIKAVVAARVPGMNVTLSDYFRIPQGAGAVFHLPMVETESSGYWERRTAASNFFLERWKQSGNAQATLERIGVIAHHDVFFREHLTKNIIRSAITKNIQPMFPDLENGTPDRIENEARRSLETFRARTRAQDQTGARGGRIGTSLGLVGLAGGAGILATAFSARQALASCQGQFQLSGREQGELANFINDAPISGTRCDQLSLNMAAVSEHLDKTGMLPAGVCKLVDGLTTQMESEASLPPVRIDSDCNKAQVRVNGEPIGELSARGDGYEMTMTGTGTPGMSLSIPYDNRGGMDFQMSAMSCEVGGRRDPSCIARLRGFFPDAPSLSTRSPNAPLQNPGRFCDGGTAYAWAERAALCRFSRASTSLRMAVAAHQANCRGAARSGSSGAAESVPSAR